MNKPVSLNRRLTHDVINILLTKQKKAKHKPTQRLKYRRRGPDGRGVILRGQNYYNNSRSFKFEVGMTHTCAQHSADSEIVNYEQNRHFHFYSRFTTPFKSHFYHSLLNFGPKFTSRQFKPI